MRHDKGSKHQRLRLTSVDLAVRSEIQTVSTVCVIAEGYRSQQYI